MSKRILKSAVNWKELEKRVPPEQINKFRAFKAKSELYLRRMLTNPPDPPPINWEAYKKTVPVPGLVDKFKSEYESYKVPYPADKMTALVDKQWAELEPQIKQFCEEMKTHILSAEKEIARINALPKYEETTMEMVRDLFPEDALDPVNKPSFWPHSADEQLGYKDPTQKV